LEDLLYAVRQSPPRAWCGHRNGQARAGLEWEAVAFCRERDDIDDFISELTEFDEQQLEQQGYSTDCRDDQQLEQRGYSIKRDYCGEQKLEQQAHPRSCEQREKLEQQGYSTDCRDEQMLEQRESPIEPDCRDEQKSEQQKQPHNYEQPEKRSWNSEHPPSNAIAVMSRSRNSKNNPTTTRNLRS
jgi:hypothetical protein